MSDKTSPPTDAPPAPADDWRTATGQLAAVSATVTRLAARDTAHGLRAYAAAWGREAPHMAVSLALGCVVAAALFALAMTRASADTTGADAAAHATALFGAVATQDAAGIGASTATPAAQTGEAPAWGAGLPAGVLRWASVIEGAAAEHGVDPRLVGCMMSIESGGQVAAQSPAGASGLLQVHPPSHPDYDVARGIREPAYNVDYAVAYLAGLIRENGGDVRRAVCMYNGGGNCASYAESQRYMAFVLPCAERGA